MVVLNFCRVQAFPALILGAKQRIANFDWKICTNSRCQISTWMAMRRCTLLVLQKWWIPLNRTKQLIPKTNCQRLQVYQTLADSISASNSSMVRTLRLESKLYRHRRDTTKWAIKSWTTFRTRSTSFRAIITRKLEDYRKTGWKVSPPRSLNPLTSWRAAIRSK